MEKNVEEIQMMMLEIDGLLDVWGLRSRPQLDSVKKKFDTIISEMEAHDKLLAQSNDGAPLTAAEKDGLTAHAARLRLLLSDLKAIPIPALPCRWRLAIITPSTKLMTLFNWRHIGHGVRKNSSSPPWAWPA